MGRTRRKTECGSETNMASETDEKFGFQSGSDFTLAEFQRYADCFKECYFGVKDMKEDTDSNGLEHNKRWEPSVEDIEGEYWRIVEQPTDEVEVWKVFKMDLFKILSEICMYLYMRIVMFLLCHCRCTMELIWKPEHLQVDFPRPRPWTPEVIWRSMQNRVGI